MTRRTRRRAFIAAAATAVLAVATAGYAYWTAAGSGTAGKTTVTTTAVTLTPGTPTAQLFPGGSADVVLTAANPNDFSVRIGVLALDTSQGTAGFAVDGGHSGCGLGVLSLTTQTNGGSGWTVPAKVGGVNGSLSITLTNALAMGTTAADACQGASFTVYLVASA